MSIAIILGSNYLIGTDGVMFVEQENGQLKEFFRVREIFRVRSEGSYLAVDVDIKDIDGNREVKLAKSRPVAVDVSTIVKYDHQRTRVIRNDDTVIIDVVQMEEEAATNMAPEDARSLMVQFGVEAILKINGRFHVAGVTIDANDDGIMINTNRISHNILAGTNGILIKRNGDMEL